VNGDGVGSLLLSVLLAGSVVAFVLAATLSWAT
jgi:hypothetical protein